LKAEENMSTKVSIIQQPQPADLDHLFAAYTSTSDLIFYGHHHPFSDLQGRTRYVNPGSLGCYHEAIARYTLLEVEQGQWTLSHRSVAYDAAGLWQTFEHRDVPEREEIWQAFFGGRRRTEP
jgi:predicted phosphodiesterase